MPSTHSLKTSLYYMMTTVDNTENSTSETTPMAVVKGTDTHFMSASVIAVLVLGSLCAILGSVYAFIYFTRINPKSHHERRYADQVQNGEENDDGATRTHLLLFRKPRWK